MKPGLRDHAPADYAPRAQAHHDVSLSRRQLLTVSLAAVLGAPWLMRLGPAAAQQVADAAAPAASPEAAAFLRFSQAITGHADLDAVTASRIYAAMGRHAGDFAEQARQLAELAAQGGEPQAVLARASEAGLRETALAVVAAWYTGTVGDDSQATVVAYRDALMYRPVRDAQSVPTYCNDRPAWWTAPPPAIGVSAPVERTREPAPTTGFPVPTTGTPAPPPSTPQPDATPSDRNAR